MINCIICLGWTPILWAAINDNFTLINKLMSHGAQATDTDYAGWSMLHLTNDAEIIKHFPSLINKASCNGKYTIISVEQRSKKKMISFMYFHFILLTQLSVREG